MFTCTGARAGQGAVVGGGTGGVIPAQAVNAAQLTDRFRGLQGSVFSKDGPPRLCFQETFFLTDAMT